MINNLHSTRLCHEAFVVKPNVMTREDCVFHHLNLLYTCFTRITPFYFQFIWNITASFIALIRLELMTWISSLCRLLSVCSIHNTIEVILELRGLFFLLDDPNLNFKIWSARLSAGTEIENLGLSSVQLPVSNNDITRSTLLWVTLISLLYYLFTSLTSHVYERTSATIRKYRISIVVENITIFSLAILFYTYSENDKTVWKTYM